MMQKHSLVIYEENNSFVPRIEETKISDIEQNEVLIKVHYSSLNYKDALSFSGHKGVTRNYPHIPGIDAAGTIEHSKSSKWQKGDPVICTGFDLGMNHPGGFSEYITVPGNWCVHKPNNLTLKQAMIFGTAGLTAALAILAINKYRENFANQKILITGATGGVGLLSALLARAEKFEVSLATRDIKNSILTEYGFNDILSPDSLLIKNDKPLFERKFSAAIDTLGGDMLSNILKILDYHGAIVSCGNVLGNNYSTTVLPFILRGVKLLGITSANSPIVERVAAWDFLSKHSRILTDKLYREITLNEIPEYLEKMLKGTHNKRTIVKLNHD